MGFGVPQITVLLSSLSSSPNSCWPTWLHRIIRQCSRTTKPSSGVNLPLIRATTSGLPLRLVAGKQPRTASPTVMANPNALCLHADHVKLSLLERQRAQALDLDGGDSQDGHISRSLDQFRDGLQALEAEKTRFEEAGDEKCVSYSYASTAVEQDSQG